MAHQTTLEITMSTRTSTAAISVAGARPGRATLALRAVEPLIGAVATILCNTLARHRRRQTERELLALSDSQLKDIGLHRSHIWYVAYGSSTPSTGRHHAGH